MTTAVATPFGNAFHGRTVLVTGHTGFKGSWLLPWLLELGAEVVGFSLPEPVTRPSHFELAGLGSRIRDERGDVRDLDALVRVLRAHRPEVVFHLAAQSIVFHSLSDPKLTFDTNAGGTVNLLEAVRRAGGARVVVVATTDKVYRNQDGLRGYRENDPLGGSDPYSASKSMSEMAVESYRHAFFSAEGFADHGVALASVRAGNVIGGGDFSDYRLVPDCMRALLAGKPIPIRNPLSIRPWQHVLEPLSGYLWLAARLLEDGPAFTEGWNFGPFEHEDVNVAAVADRLIELWGAGRWEPADPGFPGIEVRDLRLNWDKAAQRLGWRPVYSLGEALAETVTWFRAYEQGVPMDRVARDHIAAYVARARARDVAWAAQTTIRNEPTPGTSIEERRR